MNDVNFFFQRIKLFSKFEITDYHLILSSLENALVELLSLTNNTQIEKASLELLNMLLNKANALLSLAFLSLVESKIKHFNRKTIEVVFLDNSNTVLMVTNIISEIFIKLKDEITFQLPSFSKFINLIFKLPNIISNYFQSSFINHSNYYLTLCKSMLYKHLITFPLILDKIFQLKYGSFIYEAFKQTEYHKETIDNFLNSISSQSCFYSSYYIKELLTTEVETVSEINYLLPLYKGISIIDNDCNIIFSKIEKILRKNKSLITMILLSLHDNKTLRNKYLESVLVLLKDKNRLFIEDVSTYDFYMIIFSIYYIIESNKDFDHINVFDSIMKIILIVSEVSIDVNKKGIIQLLMKYIHKKMTSFINANNSKHSNETMSIKEEETTVFPLNQPQIDLLDFNTNATHFHQALNYFLYENQFKKDFNKIILNNQLQPLTENRQNRIEKDDNKPKTKYKSIKFQKKYGVYDNNANKSSRVLLEINKEEELSELKRELRLPNTSSKLKINLNVNDDYNDLSKVKPPSYIKDCLTGLHSQYQDRQMLALQHLPSLIDLQPLDLDFALKDLYSALIHIENNFDTDKDGIENLIEQSLVKLTKYSPNQMTLVLCETFFQTTNNCGLKLKFVILNVLDKAVEEISDYNKSNKIPKANQFHIYFLNVIFPLLNYLRKSKIDALIVFGDFDHLLAKFIFLICKMIKCSENHPLIYKALFESYDLFKAVIRISFLKNKTHALLESLNAYCDVLISFYNKSFIMIYPEYLAKVKEAVVFLNGLLDDNALNQELHFNILKTLNTYVINIEKFHSSYFNIDKANFAII